MTSESITSEFSFTHHKATVNGIRLHYVMGGSGEPVVLLHGWAQTWYEWKRIMPILAQHYTIIAPDLRGFGDSTKPTGGYDSQTAAEDIYELVHQLGFQEIFLVGHDIGGAVAYAYAAAHSEEVRRLVILEMVIPGFGYEEAMQPARGGGIWHLAFHTVPDMPEALITGRERFYLSWFYQYFSYDPSAITQTDIDEYVRCFTGLGGLRPLEYYRSIFDDADRNRESARTPLQMPVLALGGEACLASYTLNSMQALAENVSGGVVERCGHWVADERPDYLTEQLLSFFSEQ